MARKRNPEKDLVGTSSAAASRPRRTTPAARPKHSPTTADTPETPAHKSESAASPAASSNGRESSHEEIRALAHSYWLARGCQGGSPEEDWRRAEEELRVQALATVT